MLRRKGAQTVQLCTVLVAVAEARADPTNLQTLEIKIET